MSAKDRGGVFAAFVGTLELLDPGDRVRVAGFVVNKFRGDPALLAPGLDLLTARTGVPVLGVVTSFEREKRTVRVRARATDGALLFEADGLFANDGLRRAALESLAARSGKPRGRWGVSPGARARYDRLADIVGEAIDLAGVAKLVGLGFPKP